MISYFGDFAEDETLYIPFNTFSSNDPTASVTVTDLVDADIKVHKDGNTTEIATDGATIVINFDSITGNHLITIDTSAHSDYSTGSDYMVRLEGITVDAGTINAWIGSFSIENRFNQTVVPDAAGVAATEAEVNTACDTVTVTSIANDTITAASIAANAIGASELAADAVSEIKSGLSTVTEAQVNAQCDIALSDYDPPTRAELTTDTNSIITQVNANETKIDTIDTVVDRIEDDTQNIQAQIGTDGAGLTNMPWNASWDAEVQSECTDALNAYDPPTNTEMTTAFTEIKGATFASTDTLEAIRDRGDAAWVTGAGGSAPTVGEIRTEMETNGGKLDHLWEMTEDDSGTRRYTANALEEAPSGSGGDATAANQATIQADLDILTGADGVILNTTQANYAPATSTELTTHDTDIKSEFDSFAVGSAAISKVASSATITTGSQTGTYANTTQLDGSYHIVEDAGGNTSFYYGFDVGGNGIPVEFVWDGYAQGNNDTYTVEAYNWGDTDWDQIGTIEATVGTTTQSQIFIATTDHVGTGADDGLVQLRFTSTDGSNINTDRILCSYAVVAESVGYAEGAIWVDSAGTAGAKVYTNGTADNPCPWANALTLNTTLGLNKFHIANGNTITLGAAITNYTLYGFGWTLDLSDEAISGAYIEGAIVSGTGVEGVTNPKFKECRFGTVTLPPCGCQTCGFGVGSGAMTQGGDGQYAFIDCFSLVPGSGSPSFTFSGAGASTGINVRRWAGGATYTLDSDCTLSHEVLAGGATTITVGGADVEIRGLTRSITLTTVAATSIVQIMAKTGDIAINGTGGEVRVWGDHSDITDNSGGAVTISDEGLDTDQVTTDTAAILADTNELQGDWTNTGRLDTILDAVNSKTTNLPADPASETNVNANETKIDTIQGNVTSILEDTGTTLDGKINTIDGIVDTILIDTNSLNDTKIPDTISLAAINAEVDTALDTAISSPTADSINDYIARMKKVMVNKMEITELDGATVIYEDNDVTEYCNVAAAYASDSTTTTRKRLE